MLIEFRITKAKNTHQECEILNWFSTATMVARTRVNITLHVQCLSCLNLSNYKRICKFLQQESARAYGLVSSIGL